jgi:hypothetical protein
MKPMDVKFTFLLLLTILFQSSYSQETILASGNKPASTGFQQQPENPFKKFIGEWTLKDDDWSQNWGNGTENIKIPNHHTICKALNTNNSLLAVIDGTPPYGHIFWSYNPVKKEVDHLSSFGTTRAGVGKGTVNENGDISLKISFADEATGTYRLYTYKWVSENEYVLKSVQYNDKDEPTGYFYGGTFIRINNKKQ